VDNNLISAAFVYLVTQIPCRKPPRAQLAWQKASSSRLGLVGRGVRRATASIRGTNEGLGEFTLMYRHKILLCRDISFPLIILL